MMVLLLLKIMTHAYLCCKADCTVLKKAWERQNNHR